MPFSSDAYSPAQKTLHWLIAALVVVLVPVGLSMANLMEDGPIKNGAYELHKSFGLTVFGLALLRVAVRLVRGAPPLVPGIPAWQRAAARGSHYALYLLIILVPLSGWTATSTCCAPVNLFWTVPLTLPLPWEGGMDQSKPIFLVHYALAFALTAIVLVHVSAALHHHFVRRDRTLLRMLPGALGGVSAGEGQQVGMPHDAGGR
ncbi:MAG TPA: cytochrome b [Microvirga sp.]|jgi:cytochrome b561|nr:cytochrome b [Microvirga sp.]